MKEMRLGLCSALVLAMLAAASRASAADPPGSEVERADALFEEGRSLMERGLLSSACPKLEQSFQLAPRLGTMLNLGSCYEQSGRLARALAVYERAATMARDAGRADREQAARELSASIERRVAKLLLVVDDRSPGASIEVDGELLSTRGGLVPIDPGPHRVVVRAPDRRPWNTSIAPGPGATLRLVVPQLEPDSSRRAPLAGASAPEGAAPLRAIGVASGLGVAAIGITVGTIFGLRAGSKHDESSAHCDARGCDATGRDLIAEAKTAGNVSTAAFIGAGVGLAAAGVFVFFVPSSRGRASVGLSPALTGTTLRLHASF
jgi:Tfp pilus assembly protein PilF